MKQQPMTINILFEWIREKSLHSFIELWLFRWLLHDSVERCDAFQRWLRHPCDMMNVCWTSNIPNMEFYPRWAPKLISNVQHRSQSSVAAITKWPNSDSGIVSKLCNVNWTESSFILCPRNTSAMEWGYNFNYKISLAITEIIIQNLCPISILWWIWKGEI